MTIATDLIGPDQKCRDDLIRPEGSTNHDRKPVRLFALKATRSTSVGPPWDQALTNALLSVPHALKQGSWGLLCGLCCSTWASRTMKWKPPMNEVAPHAHPFFLRGCCLESRGTSRHSSEACSTIGARSASCGTAMDAAAGQVGAAAVVALNANSNGDLRGRQA